MNWQVQEAKQRFSEVLRAVERTGPQIITRLGEEIASPRSRPNARRTFPGTSISALTNELPAGYQRLVGVAEARPPILALPSGWPGLRRMSYSSASSRWARSAEELPNFNCAMITVKLPPTSHGLPAPGVCSPIDWCQSASTSRRSGGTATRITRARWRMGSSPRPPRFRAGPWSPETVKLPVRPPQGSSVHYRLADAVGGERCGKLLALVRTSRIKGTR